MSNFAPRRIITKPVIEAAPDPNQHLHTGLAADLEQAKLVQDTKIMQKVNQAHRQAFAEKYPGQVEHCLRLTMERLQYGLDKRNGVDITKPETWILLPEDLRDVAQTAYYLNEIRKGF
jgi:hypothetical protein